MENYKSPPATGTQTPVIQVTVDQLEKQISELQELVSALENRLCLVMREPEPSQIRADNPSVPSFQSSIAVMLRTRVQEAESISYQLSSIIRRLEI